VGGQPEGGQSAPAQPARQLTSGSVENFRAALIMAASRPGPRARNGGSELGRAARGARSNVCSLDSLFTMTGRRPVAPTGRTSSLARELGITERGESVLNRAQSALSRVVAPEEPPGTVTLCSLSIVFDGDKQHFVALSRAPDGSWSSTVSTTKRGPVTSHQGELLSALAASHAYDAVLVLVGVQQDLPLDGDDQP
jgi:hypothetical protein